MSKMISIVEAAIAEAVLETGDREFISKLGLFMESRPGLMGRAAIAAMREPTDKMDEVGAIYSDCNAATRTWQAMIDETLKS